MSVNPLNNQELKELAPTLFTSEPHYEVSDKYHFIPTIEVIEQIKSHNWYPVSVSQADVSWSFLSPMSASISPKSYGSVSQAIYSSDTHLLSY